MVEVGSQNYKHSGVQAQNRNELSVLLLSKWDFSNLDTSSHSSSRPGPPGVWLTCPTSPPFCSMLRLTGSSTWTLGENQWMEDKRHKEQDQDRWSDQALKNFISSWQYTQLTKRKISKGWVWGGSQTGGVIRVIIYFSQLPNHKEVTWFLIRGWFCKNPSLRIISIWSQLCQDSLIYLSAPGSSIKGRHHHRSASVLKMVGYWIRTWWAVIFAVLYSCHFRNWMRQDATWNMAPMASTRPRRGRSQATRGF